MAAAAVRNRVGSIESNARSCRVILSHNLCYILVVCVLRRDDRMRHGQQCTISTAIPVADGTQRSFRVGDAGITEQVYVARLRTGWLRLECFAHALAPRLASCFDAAGLCLLSAGCCASFASCLSWRRMLFCWRSLSTFRRVLRCRLASSLSILPGRGLSAADIACHTPLRTSASSCPCSTCQSHGATGWDSRLGSDAVQAARQSAPRPLCRSVVGSGQPRSPP